jgi:hypothetical protein
VSGIREPTPSAATRNNWATWEDYQVAPEGKIIRFQGFADRSGALEAAAVCDKDPSLGE